MISIIIPVYNAQESLYNCINSILNQNINNLEIILINDGSTDNSNNICDEYAKTYSNIKVIHQTNCGAAVSRKRGVLNASGDYIMFSDADDCYLPNSINTLVNNLKECDIVCGQPSPLISKVQDTIITSESEILKAFFDTRILHGAFWGSLYKRELFMDVDFCDNASIGEDINTILQVYLKANSIHVITPPVYSYKRNKNSISNSGYSNRHKIGLLKYIENRKHYCLACPEYNDMISAFYIEHEMAVFTAMCRNNIYDIDTINILKKELKENRKALLQNKSTAGYYKISALLILFNYRLFAFLFRFIRYIVGR